ncbi:hypothetical protein D6792_04120 [Candidatus Parcubacteria bacterium]|jgi:hypothetical protein|nr:MAG: hypothetical protein D6792_04120 [Candidatus Parcubacteria bacterium]
MYKSEEVKAYITEINKSHERSAISQVNSFVTYLTTNKIDLSQVTPKVLAAYLNYATKVYLDPTTDSGEVNKFRRSAFRRRVKIVYNFLCWCHEKGHVGFNFKLMPDQKWNVNVAALAEPIIMLFYMYMKDRVRKQQLKYMLGAAVRFMNHLNKQGVRLTEVQAENLEGFLAQSRSQNQLRKLQTFLQFAHDAGYLQPSPSDLILTSDQHKARGRKRASHWTPEQLRETLARYCEDERVASLLNDFQHIREKLLSGGASRVPDKVIVAVPSRREKAADLQRDNDDGATDAAREKVSAMNYALGASL